MPPGEQLDQLHKLMKEINKGNATHDEVAELFKTLAKAIKENRESLEKKIKETEGNTGKSHKETLALLKAAEARVGDSVKKTDSASKQSVEALKREFNAQLEGVRKAIPHLPDFQAMLQEIEAKIPTIPDFPKPIEYTAGRNISIEDHEITNTNPKITVSRERPSNPQRGDLWVRL